MKEDKIKKDNQSPKDSQNSSSTTSNQSTSTAKNQEHLKAKNQDGLTTDAKTKENITSNQHDSITEIKQDSANSNQHSSTTEIKQDSVISNQQHSFTAETKQSDTNANQNSSKNDTTQDSTTINQESSTVIQQKENKTEMKNEQKTTAEHAEATSMTSKERVSEANHIVKNRMIASVGAGLIPFPVVDIVALTGIQMDTVRALAKLYEIKFSKDIGKTAVGTLTGGVLPVAVGPWVSSLAKTIPVVGQIMGSISMPIIAGASTYAIGKVFIQHFESGGTFLTFDPVKVKGYFQEEFEKGKEFAKTEAKIS